MTFWIHKEGHDPEWEICETLEQVKEILREFDNDAVVAYDEVDDLNIIGERKNGSWYDGEGRVVAGLAGCLVAHQPVVSADGKAPAACNPWRHV